MWPRVLFVSLFFVTACSDVTPLEVYNVEDGALRLTVTDAPSQLGVAQLAAPFATTAQSVVSVTNARIGSTCQYATTGHADVAASSITLVITFAQRLTSCTKEIRLLSYRADISRVPKGAYDLKVIHDDSGSKYTVLTQHIVVP
jgi:hypothetical protein